MPASLLEFFSFCENRVKGKGESPCKNGNVAQAIAAIEKAYAEIVYLVPAVFKINWSGISRAKAAMASKPVQWVGTT